MNELIRTISGRHPARIIDFDYLYNQLKKLEEDKYVFSNEHPVFPYLKIFKYAQRTVVNNYWNIYTAISRGLILDTQNKKIVATPFPKFWNYGEVCSNNSELIEPEFEVYNKMDGSLGILYYFGDEWRITTCGSFVSEQAIKAQNILRKKIDTSLLDKGTTYLTEIIYPENKIVVKYNNDDLYLLAAYDKYGYEIPFEKIQNLSSAGFKIVEKYNFKEFNEILEQSKKIGIEKEGWVIKFKNGHRLKIKGEEYCYYQKIMEQVTPLHIWRRLKDNENINQVRNSLPEESLKDFDNILKILLDKANTLLNEIEQLTDRVKNISDKELGLEIQHANRSMFFYKREFKESVKFIFSMRKGVFSKEFDKRDSSVRNKFFEVIKPKNNILEGYEPSNILNRFKCVEY